MFINKTLLMLLHIQGPSQSANYSFVEHLKLIGQNINKLIMAMPQAKAGGSVSSNSLLKET